MKSALSDFILGKKGIYGILHIIILVMSLFLVISISVDTFKGIPFYTQSSYMKTQLWICIWFLFDFVLEFFGETQRTLFTDTFHFPVGSHSLSEHYCLLWMDFFSRNYLSTPFYSFVEGGICAGDCGRLADVQ